DSNLLLLNQHNGKFSDVALDADVAYDVNGVAKAGMGVDAGDVNGKGWPDLVVTNFNDEYHSLFLNAGSFPYDDWTARSHLAGYSQAYVGWGTQFLDYDNDGRLDLIIANGHINPVIEFTRADIKYKEPPLLLRNNGQAVFKIMNGVAGATFRTGQDGR